MSVPFHLNLRVQDVSRLLDLCRQSIVFESLDDLASCLQTIEADPDVTILRIKNRLDPNYNSLTTAGYRDVELNMLIINQATLDLGINTHVCEMQLIHQPFAELKVATLELTTLLPYKQSQQLAQFSKLLPLPILRIY